MHRTGESTRPERDGSPRPGPFDAARRALVLAPVVVPLLAAAIVLVGAFGEPFSYWGDKAVEETAVEEAVALDRVLGPHSNWRFAHPGPALFYLLAPVYAATGREPLALSLGALLINGTCAVGVVVVGRRLLGPAGAVAAAAVVAVHLWAWSPVGVWEHWNPALVPLPLLLALVCWAGAWRRPTDADRWTGAGPATWLVAGAVPASLVAQSHVGSVPLVVAGAGAGALGWLLGWLLGRRRRRTPAAPPAPSGDPPPRPTARRPRAPVALAVAAVALVVLWAPPVWEQVTADPGTGNLGRLVTVARHGPDPTAEATGGWSLRTAVAAVANEATRLPFRWGPATTPSAAVDLATADVAWARTALWSAGMALAAALVVLGLVLRRPVLAGLGAASLATSSAAVVAALRVPDELSNYQVWGAAVSLLPTWIGAGAVAAGALAARPGRLVGAVRGGAAAVALVAAVLFCLALRSPRPEPLGAAALAAADLLRPTVAGRGPVALSWEPPLWPVVPGVLATLRREGVDVRLVGPVEFVVGSDLVVDGTERALAVLTTAGAGSERSRSLVPPGACATERVAARAGLRVWFSPANCPR